MKRPALLLLVALLLALQGCMVTKKKYNAAIAERDRLVTLLDQRDSDLASAQDSFRKRLEAATQELDLYKGQAGDSKTAASDTQKKLEEARRAAKRFEDQIRALGVGEVRDGRLVLKGSLLFQLGSDKLSTGGRRALDKIARAFKGKDVLIQIDGHTDSTRIAKAATKRLHGSNMGLSANRALAVFHQLASKGIKERMMYVRGFGPSWPVASNATAASKAKNRRVEILFIPAALVPRSKYK